MMTKRLSSVSDAVVNTMVPPRGRALPPDVLDAQLAELKEAAMARREYLKRFRRYRRRWIQLNDDEIVDLLGVQLAKRAAGKSRSVNNARQEFATRLGR